MKNLKISIYLTILAIGSISIILLFSNLGKEEVRFLAVLNLMGCIPIFLLDKFFEKFWKLRSNEYEQKMREMKNVYMENTSKLNLAYNDLEHRKKLEMENLIIELSNFKQICSNMQREAGNLISEHRIVVEQYEEKIKEFKVRSKGKNQLFNEIFLKDEIPKEQE